MAYIEKADLQDKRIESSLLAALDATAGSDIITTAINQAIGQLKSKIPSMYDLSAELALTGASRDDFLLMIGCDLAIYHIWTYYDGSSIPEKRAARYNAALDFLTAINEGKEKLNIALSTDTTTDTIVGGSNTKRTNHF